MIIFENFWPIYRMTHRFIGSVLLESRVHKGHSRVHKRHYRVHRGHSLFTVVILGFIGGILLESRFIKRL